jgi:uncharacterized damage-inducible protein DinB
MELSDACCTILGQLSNIVKQIDSGDFSRPSKTLGNSTVGQHLRHTLEFFICLEKGFNVGVVNYDQRDHDQQIETDKYFAQSVIDRIQRFVSDRNPNRPLLLEVGYERDNENSQSIETNYYRELTYNIEHAVHHMAIMKIGLREVAPYLDIPANFGIALSTIRHKESLVPVR